MRSSSAVLALLAATALAGHRVVGKPSVRSYDTHHYFSLETDPSASVESASSLAASLGVQLVERVGELNGHWLVRCDKSSVQDESQKRDYQRGYLDVIERWQGMKRKRSIEAGRIKDVRHLPVRKRSKRQFEPETRHNGTWLPRDSLEELTYAQTSLSLVDPLLPKQWHLINTVMPDIELNVTGLWSQEVNGKGVKVAIIDDGLDMNSDDLKENFYAEGSWDFNDHTDLPEPRLSDDQHGTRCAGEIAAVPNDVCGVGVAYRSQVAGVRILSAPISDADEAAALNYEYQKNEIYSCSWGPPDDGKSMEAPENLILKAMVNGVQKGRDGKGSIFVFAAGNGGGLDDQCNFDGYTNSIFSLTIGAVDRKGLHPYYSEMCAAMLVVAPSSGSGDHIHTTDVGKDECTDLHGGTSAAAPLVVGVVALALQVRPELGWRDIQHLMVNTAVHFNPEDPDWETTAIGRPFSYKYGYGRVNAGAFVEAARDWKLVKPQAWFDSPAIFLETSPAKRQGIDPPQAHAPDGSVTGDADVIVPNPTVSGVAITEEGVTSSFTVTQDMLDDLNMERLEHITVRVWIEHERRGDVEVELTSPNGIVSVLARQRRFDESTDGFTGWKFMSMKHWDENPVGEWTIRVLDRINPDKTGRFKSWSLQLWGEAADASKTKLWAPALEGQEDEEQVGSEPVLPTTTAQKPKPTNLLPGDHGQAEGESHKPGLGDPSPNPPGQDGVETDDGVESPGVVIEDTGVVEAGADEGYFKGIETLATKTNFIAGAGGVILLAVSAMGLFFYLRSRRKRSLFRDISEGERGTYQPVDSLQMGLLGTRKNGDRANGGSKDLYDAFAEGDISEDEDEEPHIRETSALRYHDSFLDDEDAENDHREHENLAEPSADRDAPKDDREVSGESTGSTSSASTPRPESQNRLLSP